MIGPRFVVVFCIGLAGCTARNPAACCTSPEECAAIGFDEITPCLGVQVCVEGGHCIDPQCTTAEQCGGQTPYCVDQVCSAICSDDDSCVGVVGSPHCDDTGACVECTEADQCPTDAPVCDAQSNNCRPCSGDGECSSGICLATEGRCLESVDAVYVVTAGTDAGACTETEPCATVGYALGKVTTQRRVIRLPGIDYLPADVITIDRAVYLDAAGTQLRPQATTGPVITLNNLASVTIEGLAIVDVPSGRGVDVIDQSTVLLYDVVLEGGTVALNVDTASAARLSKSHAADTRITCDHGQLDLDDNELVTTRLETTFCSNAISRNVFDERAAGISLSAENGQSSIENNLFLGTIANGGQIELRTMSAPSTIRFNTMRRPAPQSSILCLGGATTIVSSNIVASHASAPVSGTGACVVDHSLFAAEAGVVPGVGNVTFDYDSIFVDPMASNFRPVAASGALEGGDPASDLLIDLEGAARPNPAGTPPDIGAYEEP